MDLRLREFLKPRPLALYAITSLVLVCLAAGGYLLIHKLYQDQKAQMLREADLAAEAFVGHTEQIISQVDTLLHAVRMVYTHSGLVDETDRFIDGLGFDRSMIDNLYVINAKGEILITHDPRATPLPVTDRDYFIFHQANSSDQIFISAVESGRVTGEYHFRVTRPILNLDGTLAGIVLATVKPGAFTSYFQNLKLGQQNTAALAGILDKRLRARVPEPEAGAWAIPIESPVWEAVARQPTGSYENRSSIDHVLRTFTYRKVGDLPLVIVVGFSDEDVRSRAAGMVAWVYLVEGLAILFVLAAAAALLAVIINHDQIAQANRQLNELYLQVRDQALYDALTGLPGRILFADRLERALLAAEREGRKCSLMFLDLDGFKDINDTFGHDAGDEFLKIISSRMRRVLRATDTICRWGGDEFTVLLPHYGGSGEVFEIARRMLDAIQEPVEIKGATCSVTASIGVAGFPDNGRQPAELHRAADQAMYTAKRQGKAQVVFA
jgi:diguanylate cyclase (GGDEF)-like protein